MTAGGTTIASRCVPGGPELRYLEAGGGDGLPVVLLHSLGTDSGIWSSQIPALARGHRVLAPDSRGHGASSWESPLDVRRWNEDLDRVLDAARVERVALVGLSMGGVQALAYALECPDRVAALVLADTFAELEPEVAQAKVSQLALVAEADGMAALAVAYVAETLTGSPPADRVAAVRDPIAGMSVEAYVASAGCCFGARFAGRLGEVDVPTLVLWGTLDAKTPRALSERLASGIAAAALTEIPDAGHLSNLENPEAFTAAVAQFVGAPEHVVAELGGSRR
jgi:3-oxoadipate enol-lactonase